MLAAVDSGSIDAIVTRNNDRLHRSPKELEASSISSSAGASAWPWLLEGTTTSQPRTGASRRGSWGPLPARNPRTGAGACDASTPAEC
jgi:hypothetical protein